MDVSHTMVGNSTADLEGAVKAVNLFIQQKILFKPKDEVGLVLFGTEGCFLPFFSIFIIIAYIYYYYYFIIIIIVTAYIYYYYYYYYFIFKLIFLVSVH